MTRTGRTRKPRQNADSQRENAIDKENNKMKDAKVKKTEGKSRSKASTKAPKVYCSCRKPDDGTPMILCAECKEWYHFSCIDLSERDAEEIQAYICPACHEKTGLHTVMEWEGPAALEPVEKPTPRGPAKNKSVPEPMESEEEEEERPEPEEQEESSDDGSDDEFVMEKTTTKGKRRAPPVSGPLGSDSDSADEKAGAEKAAKRLRRKESLVSQVSQPSPTGKQPTSPGPSSQLKRKQSATEPRPPSPKRKRSDSTTNEDPARKYCLGKLEEVFCQIFLRYPSLSKEPAQGEDVEAEQKAEELSPEEKAQIEEKAKRFAADLEQCMYELYSEPDKTGKHGVAGKYKERFRMLTFNLSKPDRVVLHTRIASSQISPKELSTMSSTDLASEEAKQSIRQAEQEALAHSILKKTTLPRAKITHKGLQDIEDINGGARRDMERENEQEEEDRIERERLARLSLQAQRAQAANQAGQASASQSSVPPESPTTSQAPSWGGPPSLPAHAMQPQSPGASSSGDSRPPVNPLFVPTPSELAPPPVENELNLDDLINIDEEPSQEAPTSSGSPSHASPPPAEKSTPPSEPAHASPAPTTPTGISPFAAKPESGALRSFDLSTLWTPKEDPTPESKHEEPPPEPARQERPAQPHAPLDLEILGEEADDQDFDMFLNKDEDEKAAPAPVEDNAQTQRAAFETLPVVWTGKLSMPLDSTIPQEVSLTARQIGGRGLGGSESLLWKTLFPSTHLRIDGRVAVHTAAQYLTQMRLNPSKELVAAAFVPDSEASSISFDTLAKYLIAKGRHGLVFPWGNRPKDHLPGRELYIVPLLPSEPVPDYMELLDNLRLPKLRNTTYLVGIWVLNKGKLAPPPAPAEQPAPRQVPAPHPPPAMAPPAPSNVPPPTTGLPPMQPAPAANLAAEVASLTPEQIQAMLRQLSASSGLPPVQQPNQPPPAQTPVPPAHMQPWAHPTPGYPTYPPPQPPAPQHPVPIPEKSYNGPPPSHYEQRYDQHQNMYPPPGGHYDSYNRGGGGGGGGGGGDRGYRGRGGGRGRGRGQGQGFDRPRDSGWKSRGRGGRGGPSSPPRDNTGGRWDGSTQRWS